MESALKNAQDKDLDLVMVSENAKPPVCRIIDYGQYRYQQQKKEKQARKSSKTNVIKELKMSPKISDHDYQVRVNRGREFLGKGYTVKLLIFFRGREIIHPELGSRLVTRFLEDVSDIGKSDQGISKAHRNIIAMISPLKS